MSQRKRNHVCVAFGLVATSVVTAWLLPPTLHAGVRFRDSSVGGVAIDGNGVVRQATVQAQQRLRERALAEIEGSSGDLALPAEFRKISLRGLESAIADAIKNNLGVLPEEVKYLGGIQRITHIFVFPEHQDIVLAGPGEGWKVDDKGNVVGVTTGRPVIHVDDLLVALRSARSARDVGVTCSIDPTPEGLRAFDQLMKRQRTFNPNIIPQIEKLIGPQNVTVTGVPGDSHFARVLVACDYRMKRIGMQLDPSPVPTLPSFLEVVEASRRMPRTTTPRWWLACNYEPLARSEDGLSWQLRGPGVKAMTEADIIAADGSVQHTGKADPLGQKWADLMTENYDALSRADIVFGQLRNLMDLCVIAALIEHEQLAVKADCPLPMLMSENSRLMTETWNPAKTVATECSVGKKGRQFIITASGGVQIESWQVIQNVRTDSQVQQARLQAVPSASSDWCWN